MEADQEMADTSTGELNDAASRARGQAARALRRAQSLTLREVEAAWAGDYVYGVIATLVALGTEAGKPDLDALHVSAYIVVGAVAIWLAHALAILVADWIRDEEDFTPGMVLRRLRATWAIVSAAFPPVLVIGLAETGIYSVGTGLWWAEAVGLAALAVIGIWSAVHSRRPMVFRVLYVVALVALGWLIVGLEQAAKYI